MRVCFDVPDNMTIWDVEAWLIRASIKVQEMREDDPETPVNKALAVMREKFNSIVEKKG